MVSVVSRHERAGDFESGLITCTTTGIDRGGKGAARANCLLNLARGRPSRRDVILRDAGKVYDQVDLLGIDPRLSHRDLGGVHAKVSGRFVLRYVQSTDPNIFLEVHV